ncbi:MAG: GerW family sporulation protein [Mycobacterium leprae]
MASEFIDNLVATLEKHLTTKSVIGEAVTFGDVTMVPVMDLMFGAGGGSGEGRDEKSQGGSGSGGGMAARLSPKAVIVIKNGEAQILPLSKGSAIEKIVEAVPGLVEKLSKLNVTVKKADKPEEKPAEEIKAE